MALETATYVGGLVATNPTAADPKSQGDDHLRLIKTTLLNTFAGFPGMIVVTGTEAQGATANDYTLTLSPAPAAYTSPMLASFKATHANTGAATLQIGALGTKPLIAVDGTALKSGDIENGGLVAVFYDGTSFFMISGNDRANRNGDTYSGTHDFSGATAVTLPAGTAIGTVSATEIGYLDGVISAVQTQLDARSEKAGETYSGTHDFSGATAVTVPTPTAGAHAATKAYADGLAFSTALPSQTGNAGKYVTTDGMTASWEAPGPPPLGYSARTSNTQLGANDKATLIDITSGTFTQTFAAASTLGAGWWCYYRISGSGNITFDANGTETFDGQLTGVAYPGCTYLVVCTGTGFTVAKVAGKRVELKTSGTSWTVPMGVWSYKARLQGAGGSGARGNDGTTCFAGGSAGGYLEVTKAATPGASISYSIGAGGAEVLASNTAGNNGGLTQLVIGVHVAYGGAGGPLGYNIPAVGGAVSGGDLNIPGGHSEVGAAYFPSSKLSASAGGRSMLGAGGRPQTDNNAGSAATGYGSGGYGSNWNFISGAGMPGCIILEY